MKLLNIFKKATSASSITKKTKVQPLDKNQLNKVIGGADNTTTVAGGPLKGIDVKLG